MSKQDKYFGTYTMINGDKFKKLEALGYNGSHTQFRVVCKAKSMTEANKIAESYGLSNRCFQKDYTSETANDIELELVDKYGFIVCINGTIGDKFVSVKELL